MRAGSQVARSFSDDCAGGYVCHQWSSTRLRCVCGRVGTRGLSRDEPYNMNVCARHACSSTAGVVAPGTSDVDTFGQDAVAPKPGYEDEVAYWNSMSQKAPSGTLLPPCPALGSLHLRIVTASIAFFCSLSRAYDTSAQLALLSLVLCCVVHPAASTRRICTTSYVSSRAAPGHDMGVVGMGYVGAACI